MTFIIGFLLAIVNGVLSLIFLAIYNGMDPTRDKDARAIMMFSTIIAISNFMYIIKGMVQ